MFFLDKKSIVSIVSTEDTALNLLKSYSCQLFYTTIVIDSSEGQL